METKAVKKKESTKTKVLKATVTSVDPFAEKVEATLPTPKVVKLKATTEAATPKAIRVRKAVVANAARGNDAFSSPIAETSPVKKPAQRKAAVKSTGPVKAVSKTKKTVVAADKVKKKPSTRKKVGVVLKSEEADLSNPAELSSPVSESETSTAFKLLADVSLPELKSENRARLLMQSPTRLYFYWSVRENPWKALRNMFGDDLGSYSLVLKLTDLRKGSEEIHRCDAEGEWWFAVEPDGEYQAEIGFYATNRPYFRVIYSNTITTPRRSPSPHPASEARWTVSADKFAEVLDVAGFAQDAFDVAMAGDDVISAEGAARTAFAHMLGNRDDSLEGIAAEDLRYAMLALASGSSLEEMRFRVGARLFAILQANASTLAARNAQAAIAEHFNVNGIEWTEELPGPAVYGASLVHFPKTLKTRRVISSSSPRFNPVSSYSLGR